MPSRRGLFRLALLAVVLAARHAPANSNKLLNPGFDGGLTHWSVFAGPSFAATYSPWFGHSGAGSLVVSTTGTAAVHNVVFRQIVNVNPSASYSFGTYFLYSQDSATTPYASVAISWWSGLGGMGTLAGYVETAVTPAGPAGTWLSCQAAAVSPALAKSAVVDFVLKTSESKTALAVFDDPYFWGGANGGVIGDANGDGKLDVGDVFFLVNYLFSNGPLPIGPSDVNNDFEVDVSDAFYLINYLFGGGPAPK